MNEINIWDECLRAFDDVLTDKDMKTWFLPLEVKQNSSTLRVIAPNRFIRDQIESEYLNLIRETVALKSSNSITEVELMLPGSFLSKIVTGTPFLINCKPMHTPCIQAPIMPTELHLYLLIL